MRQEELTRSLEAVGKPLSVDPLYRKSGDLSFHCPRFYVFTVRGPNGSFDFRVTTNSLMASEFDWNDPREVVLDALSNYEPQPTP